MLTPELKAQGWLNYHDFQDSLSVEQALEGERLHIECMIPSPRELMRHKMYFDWGRVMWDLGEDSENCYYRKLAPVTTWQPIESAPKGDVIMVYISHNSTPEIGGWYTTAIYTEQGFLSTSDSNPEPIFLKPTHWQPLPEPPKE